MKISIICPIYNAENYIEDLYFNINRQKDVYIEEINFILTESKDNTEDKLKKIGCTYEKINKEKFSSTPGNTKLPQFVSLPDLTL